jgi:hypothetical protein
MRARPLVRQVRWFDALVASPSYFAPSDVCRRKLMHFLFRRDIRMAMHQLPFAIAFAKELRYTYSHVHRTRRIANLYCRDLESGPEAQVSIMAMLDRLKVACSIRMEGLAIFEIAICDSSGADQRYLPSDCES